MTEGKFATARKEEIAKREAFKRRSDAIKAGKARAKARKQQVPKEAIIVGDSLFRSKHQAELGMVWDPETRLWVDPLQPSVSTKPQRTPGLRVDESAGINPKDIVGVQKIDLSLLPAIALDHYALAQIDGDIKYGPYNWRVLSVQARTYVAAAKRHLDDWMEGEEFAPDSLAHHLGHVIACCGILLDAQAAGKLVDNRPLENPGYFEAKADITRRAKERRARG